MRVRCDAVIHSPSAQEAIAKLRARRCPRNGGCDTCISNEALATAKDHARDIRRKKTEYVSDAAQRQRIGQIEDAQQTAEYKDVFQQEADLTAGHGVLRATGLVAISASDPDELESAVSAVEQAAIQASCETRRLWGQQAQAFAAVALPLCRGL